MAELLADFLGKPPFREVTVRYQEQDYILWLGEDVSVGDFLCSLERTFETTKMRVLSWPDLADGDALPEAELVAVASEADTAGGALLLRSSRSRAASSSPRCARPPLSDLFQLSTTGSSNSHVYGGVCTAYGPRISNEDAYICSADWSSLKPETAEARASGRSGPSGLFAVCDGHGGGSVSELLPELLSQTLMKTFAEDGAKDSVEAAFEAVDDSLRQGLGDGGAERCGSTCAMCITWPQGAGDYRVILANLGDSRALLYRPRGDWEHLAETRDHKPDVPSEKKRIRAAGGYVIPGDDAQPARLDAVLATSRAFGNFRFKDPAQTPGTRKVSPIPDVSILDAKVGDVVVLVTDGVLDVLSGAEVTSLAVQGLRETQGDAVEAAADVVWAALQANTQDNVTCVVIQLR